MHRVNVSRPRTAGIALVACLSGVVVAGCLGEDGEGKDAFGYNGNQNGNQNGGPGQQGGPGGPGSAPGGGGAPGNGGDMGHMGVEVIGQNQGVDIGGPTV